MFRAEDTNEDSNFWISYADLMAGLLFVFILLIGAIVSKSIILKSDLHNKEAKLTSLSKTLKDKETSLDEISDTLAKSKALVSEKDSYLSENEKLIAQKNARIADDAVHLNENEKIIAEKNVRIAEDKKHLSEKEKLLLEKENLLTLNNTRIAENEKQLSEKEKLIQLNNARIAKDQMKLSQSERMFKLKISEIEKLNKLLLESNTRESQLSDKIVIVQNMLDKNEDELKKNKDELNKNKDLLTQNTKTLKDYEGKVVILSNDLSQSKDNVKIKDEKLLTLLNAMDEKKTKYDTLVSNLQSQKAKIKSLTGIKLQVVAALKDSLGNQIDIDKKTGSLRLASNILFGSGEDVLKPEAKIELKKAFEEYIGTLVNNPRIKPHLDQIIIEGHTDSDGSYIYNLNLSQKRALAVMEYFLTLDFSKKHNIRPLMTASGRAYLDAIKVNGVEDKEASRRIEIKFRLKNQDAMQEIEKVLDAN